MTNYWSRSGRVLPSHFVTSLYPVSNQSDGSVPYPRCDGSYRAS